ncbi:SRPBCC family protein [Actinoplanes sp. NPDC049118]|uniref:SRPBCC family protein n=1 Tax=Actinoplanes sp. NPDC049118 TaxID=3155769 RepID=UPI0033F9FDB9
MADDTFTVTRSMSIQASPERVYEQIVDFHRWRPWSPWEDLDPDMQRNFSGSEAGAGAVYEWDGNSKAGKGRMEIVEVSAPSAVGIDLAFEKPFKARQSIRFTIEPEGAGSRVTWTLVGKKTFMVRAMGIIRSMDKMVGPDFEKGLARLKVVAEGPAGL